MSTGIRIKWIGRTNRTSPGCFICGGQHLECGYSLIMPVYSKRSGQNIVDMFQGIGARLDYWSQDVKEKFVQVVISTCHDHQAYLDILETKITNRTINPRIVKETKNYQNDKFEIQQKDGTEVNPFRIEKTLRYFDAFPHQYKCFICNSKYITHKFSLHGEYHDISKLINPESIGESSEPWNIEILSCDEHRDDLVHLKHIIHDNDHILNSDIIAKCIHDSNLSQLDKKFNCHKCYIFLSR